MSAFASIAETLNNLKAYNSTPQLFRFTSIRTLLLQSASESVKFYKFTDSDSGIFELTLERPEAKNAIGWDMLKGLENTFEAVNKDNTAKLLMISSSVPKVFCAGADLKFKMPLEYKL